MNNAGTRHSVKRPREPWVKSYTKQGQGQFYALQFDRLEELAEKLDADLGHDGPYLRRQMQRAAYHLGELGLSDLFDGESEQRD